MRQLLLRTLPRSFQLKLIVRRMPKVLARRFGGGACYTPAQVRRAAANLGVRRSLLAYAYAVACSRSGFAEALPGADEHAYDMLRDELVLECRLPRADFTVAHLAARPPFSVEGNPAPTISNYA